MQLQRFAPHDIRFRGVRSHGGWSLKLFSVVYGETPFDVKDFEPPVDMALDSLPSLHQEQGRPGLGFLIAHQGRAENYLILAWWSNGNELPINAWVRRQGEDWRPALEGESVCVWDLEVVWEERQAWIATMMSGPARPDDYLAHVPTRFQVAAREPSSPTGPLPRLPTPPTRPDIGVGNLDADRPGSGAGRPRSRGDLPEEYRSLLPRRGVLAGAGGLSSAPWRVVIDFDSADLRAARGKDMGGSVLDPLPHTRDLALTTDQVSEVEGMSIRILEEDRTPQTVSTADAMGVLIVVDGDRAWELSPAGPITQGPPAELSRLLYEMAWGD